jgi:hypothetical protein
MEAFAMVCSQGNGIDGIVRQQRIGREQSVATLKHIKNIPVTEKFFFSVIVVLECHS